MYVEPQAQPSLHVFHPSVGRQCYNCTKIDVISTFEAIVLVGLGHRNQSLLIKPNTFPHGPRIALSNLQHIFKRANQSLDP
jgi:hypothetical protein